MRRAVKLRLWLVGAALVLPAWACRRAADAPLAAQQLFPDAVVAAPQAIDSAKGTVVRAETVAETEPNDSPTQAQPLPASALVGGQLQASADRPDAAAAGRRPKAKGGGLLDEDWYRLPAIPAQHLAHIELREGPACSDLELYDDSGRNLLRRAARSKTARPVLPALGPAAHASLVRVVCKGKEGGSYTLALFTRPQLPGEEVEPNDDASLQASPWPIGAPMQGTLAPLQDVDTFILDGQGRDPAELQSLSVTGVPDVEWTLALLDPQTRQPLLQRRGSKGEGCIVPNLDLARLPPRTLLQLRATSGQAADAPYALGIQPLLPPGCTRQADCRDRLPSEREPNDSAAFAQPLALGPEGGGLVAGVIDSADDTDQFLLQGTPNQVASLRLEAPPSLAVRLQVNGASWVAAAGQRVVVAGVQVAADGRLVVAVTAERPRTWSRHEAYRLAFAVVDGTAWEQERADEAQPAQLWTAAGAMQAVEARGVAGGVAGGELGGWLRRGVLATADDTDTFGLDLRAETAPVGLELSCAGDGAAGLQCEILDFQGRPLLQLAAPVEGEQRTPLALPPGAYRVAVRAVTGRPSLRPYAVALSRAPAHAGLPLAATPAAP